MTVINGDGLVGRVTTVGPATATVLLANDPDFTVGTRMEKTDELGFATGQGDRPLRVQLLNGKAKVQEGRPAGHLRLQQADKPFVPGVPVGKVVRVDPSGGDLTRTVYVQPVRRLHQARHRRRRRRRPRARTRATRVLPRPKPTPKPDAARRRVDR